MKNVKHWRREEPKCTLDKVMYEKCNTLEKGRAKMHTLDKGNQLTYEECKTLEKGRAKMHTLDKVMHDKCNTLEKGRAKMHS